MKKTAIFIGMMAITMAMSGQSMKMSMDGDDPTQWERQWMCYDYVTRYMPLFAFDSDLDSIVDNGVDPRTVEAKGISLVTLTQDSLTIEWKVRSWKRRYFAMDFDVDSVEYVSPSPIVGWDKTVFHLSGNEGWEEAKATLMCKNNRWKLYIQDEEAIYYFRGSR